jgi:ketosteroid isomerase-like protein
VGRHKFRRIGRAGRVYAPDGRSEIFRHEEGGFLADASCSVPMSPNKKVIESYFAGTDRSKVAPLLADDVEWIEWGDGVPPTGVRTKGKAAFIQNFGSDELHCEISRLTEENNVVVAEGTVRVHKKEGRELRVQFCNIFELENGKITRKSSFGALVKDSA